MYLQQLRLTDFKNCQEAKLEFSAKINCFLGRNGAGKTNLLDAIYYLSFCKSYFNNIDQQNIRHEAPYFSLHADYQRNGDIDQVACVQKRNQKKSFRFNKKEYDRLADHIGKIPLVMISPYDRDLINEGSESRRRFLDGMISQFDPIYLDALLKYNKSLLQRNVLIRQIADNTAIDMDLLSLWNEQLVKSGSLIFEKRQAFITDFLPIFFTYYDFVSGQHENVDITYESGLQSVGFLKGLEQSFERDRILRYTTFGIHKDDLSFQIHGFPLKKFGSQGQQKSFVIALKLAQFAYTHQKIGYLPILLLDDIFDKLDEFRVAQIIQLVGQESFGQVFISDTQPQRIRMLFESAPIDHRLFSVSEGFVELLES
jgi:DNA replication and repair protein RecF